MKPGSEPVPVDFADWVALAEIGVGGNEFADVLLNRGQEFGGGKVL
jgi:hypothetical protein